MSEAWSGGKGDRNRSKPGNELDMGKLGCKRGYHVFRNMLTCVYCNKTKKELDDTCN